MEELLVKSRTLIGDKLAYLIDEMLLTQPSWANYFWALILFSLAIAIAEWIFPWRRQQKLLRKQFWLDVCYMFFNFYIFNIFFISWMGVFALAGLVHLSGSAPQQWQLIDISALPLGWQLLLFFIIIDFVQWAGHRFLHRVDLLWELHKVHHSVEEMSFPAHLRYHWFENIFYTPIKYLTVTLLFGLEPELAFITHYIAILIGHLNHANLKLSYGPLKYLLNNPVMHIWHHARHLPRERRWGANFGISLSLWDYLFGTAYLPEVRGDIELGFPKLESFPQSFWRQELYPFIK